VPAAIVGLLLHDRIEVAFASPMLVAAMLLVTGTLLFGIWFVKTDGRPLGWSRAIVIGIAQAIAILPGISRSGATIAAGVYSGVGREESFEFSFLLAVPAILGAALLELRNSELSALNPMTAAAGVLVALMSGILALALLKRAVVGRRLYLFAFYCWLAGLGALVFVR
jgi:undecaprenyl-diphosphatase